MLIPLSESISFKTLEVFILNQQAKEPHLAQ
mgnify:CR=1 FL=1